MWNYINKCFERKLSSDYEIIVEYHQYAMLTSVDSLWIHEIEKKIENLKY